VGLGRGREYLAALGDEQPATPWLESTVIVIAWWPFGTLDEKPLTCAGATNDPFTMN